MNDSLTVLGVATATLWFAVFMLLGHIDSRSDVVPAVGIEMEESE